MVLDFKDFILGNKQTFNHLSIVPIISEKNIFHIAPISDICFERCTDYGVLEFSKKNSLPFIIPSGFSILSKEQSSHTILNSIYLDSNTDNFVLNKECCIDDVNKDLLTINGVLEYRFLPFDIRKKFFIDSIYNRTDKGCFRLIEYVNSFEEGLLKDNESSLSFFFSKYNEFFNILNKQFEAVEGQIGAIILIDDKVIGIEILPSKKLWKAVWRGVINDCYGSEIIRRDALGLLEFVDKTYQFDNCKCNKELMLEILNVCSMDLKKSRKQLLDISNIDFNIYSRNDISKDLTQFKLYDNNNVGELFTYENKIIYLSLLL